MWHEHEEARQGLVFAIDVNPKTGAIVDGEFAGQADLVRMIPGEVSQDYGYGNRSFSAQRIYRMIPDGDGDQKRLKAFMTLEPKAVLTIEYVDAAKTQLKFVEINLSECSVTETNLGERLFNYE